MTDKKKVKARTWLEVRTPDLMKRGAEFFVTREGIEGESRRFTYKLGVKFVDEFSGDTIIHTSRIGKGLHDAFVRDAKKNTEWRRNDRA